jgi:hypothetical protein
VEGRKGRTKEDEEVGSMCARGGRSVVFRGTGTTKLLAFVPNISW